MPKPRTAAPPRTTPLPPARPRTPTTKPHGRVGLGAGFADVSATAYRVEDARALVNLAVALAESGLEVLSDHLTSPAQLRHNSALIPGGTLGKHFRHVAETYDAFLAALRTSTFDHTVPQIDYNAMLPLSRQRVALDLTACQDVMLKVRDGLTALGELQDLEVVLQQPVEVIAITPTRQEMNSTLGRELWFCSLHAIHHYTMVRVIAVHELGIDLPIEFGTAPATIHYRGKGWKAPPVSPPAFVKSKL